MAIENLGTFTISNITTTSLTVVNNSRVSLRLLYVSSNGAPVASSTIQPNASTNITTGIRSIVLITGTDLISSPLYAVFHWYNNNPDAHRVMYVNPTQNGNIAGSSFINGNHNSIINTNVPDDIYEITVNYTNTTEPEVT